MTQVSVCNRRTPPPTPLTEPFPENAFTPWFKLIARDFLYGWWDELVARKGADGTVRAKSLNGIVDGSKVVSMV